MDSDPYHLGEWEQKRHAPKKELQAELEAYMQISLKAGKPVVAVIEDEFCNTRMVAEALAKLAPHVNLIIKRNVFDTLPEIPNAYLWPDKTFAPNLLRFAADVVLAGYNSGTFSTCTMLGVPVIPYYTLAVYLYDYTAGTRSDVSYKTYMPKYSGSSIQVDIIKQINSPVNLAATDVVLRRIKDAEFWNRYAERLPAAQKSIFGEYIIDGAAVKTAQLLLRAFIKGSLGADTSAVHIKSEYVTEE